MRLPFPLVRGTLIQRYKRFLADVRLDDGGVVTATCPNTGSMLGCADPGMRVWLSRAANPARKYAWTWEQVEALPGVPVGIHTGRSNGLVREAIETGVLRELAGYPSIKGEVMAVFQRLNDGGKTVVLITHEPDIAEYARRIVVFRDGKVVEDRPAEQRRAPGVDRPEAAG